MTHDPRLQSATVQGAGFGRAPGDTKVYVDETGFEHTLLVVVRTADERLAYVARKWSPGRTDERERSLRAHHEQLAIMQLAEKGHAVTLGTLRRWHSLLCPSCEVPYWPHVSSCPCTVAVSKAGAS